MKHFSLLKNLTKISASPASIFALLGLLLLIAALVKIKKVKFTTKLITQVAIAVALSVVLNLFKLYTLPQGGAITLGSMIPILLMAFLYGPEVGLLTGLLYGILNLILDPYILNPVQVLFDYPLPYMALGLAGYFKNNFSNADAENQNKLMKFIKYPLLPTFIAVFVRFLCHYISGIVFFADYAPEGQSVYLYSLIYNGSFLSIDFVICLVILAVLPIKQLHKVLGVSPALSIQK